MKSVKTVLIVLVALIALVVIGLAVFAATFDANRYRTLVSEEVEAATGLRLNIAGELRLTLWPNIELQMNGVSLEDPGQQNAQPLLTADRIDGKVALMPLLQRDIQIDAIDLQAPVIYFMQGAAGNNWQTLLDTTGQDTAGQDAKGTGPESGESDGVHSLAVNNFNISKGTLYYQDTSSPNQPPSKHELRNLDAQLSLSASYDIKLALSTLLTSTSAPEPIQLSLRTEVTTDENFDQIDARDLVVEFADQEATLNIPALSYDQTTAALEIQEFELTQKSLTLNGSVSATQLADTPEFSGRFNLDQAELAQLFALAELETPAELDIESLGRVSLQTTFTGNADGVLAARDLQLNLQDLGVRATGSLDRAADGKISGNLTLPDFAMAVLQKRLGDFFPAPMRSAKLPNTSVTTRFSYDSEKNSFGLTSTDLKALGLNVKMNGEGTLVPALVPGKEPAKDAAFPTFNGHLTLANFSPKDLLRYTGTQQETSLNTALTLMNLDADVSVAEDHLKLSKIKSKLDKSALTGELTLGLSEQSAYQFDLAVDTIEITDYLSPDEPAAATAASGATASAEDELGDIALPTELLSGYSVDGHLQVGRLGIADLQLKDAKAALKVADGKGSFGPLKASLYGGSFDGQIDLRGPKANKPPTLKIDGTLKDVAVADLLKAVADTASLTGKTTMTLNLLGEGDTLLAATTSSNGSFKMQVSDGQFMGLDLGYKLCELYNRLKSKPLPPASSEGTTPFKNLRASATVTDGVAQTNDLLISNDYLSVTGAGRARLARQSIHYDLDVKLAGPVKIENCETLTPFVGNTIPVKVTGTFDAPEVRPDFGRLVVQQIKQRVEEKITNKLFDLLGGKKDRNPEPE